MRLLVSASCRLGVAECLPAGDDLGELDERLRTGVLDQRVGAVDRQPTNPTVGMELGDFPNSIDTEFARRPGGSIGQITQRSHRLQPAMQLDRTDVGQRRCPAPNAGTVFIPPILTTGCDRVGQPTLRCVTCVTFRCQTSA